MKKLFCALVCLIAAFSLIACGSSIGAPKNVRIENEFLKWDSVDKATGYVVKVNSTEIETAFLSTEVALSDESVASKLIEGSNTFYVKALAKKGSSGFSDGVEYIHTTVPETQKLPAPSLSFDTVQKK